jgi:hypothetical protein
MPRTFWRMALIVGVSLGVLSVIVWLTTPNWRLEAWLLLKSLGIQSDPGAKPMRTATGPAGIPTVLAQLASGNARVAFRSGRHAPQKVGQLCRYGDSYAVSGQGFTDTFTPDDVLFMDRDANGWLIVLKGAKDEP